MRLDMVIHALRYSLYRTAYGCHPNELTVLTGLPQDFRVPLPMVAMAPLRLLRLLRLKLWMLSKTLRETLTRARWQHIYYLMDGGIMDEFTCSIMASCKCSDTPNHAIIGPLRHLVQCHEITLQFHPQIYLSPNFALINPLNSHHITIE